MKQHNIVLLLMITVIGIWYTPNRNIQHLLCAIVIPQLYIEGSKIKIFGIGVLYLWKHGYLWYFINCLLWEFYQFIYRGFLQVDQLTFDVIGIVLSYIIFGVLVMKVKKRDSLRWVSQAILCYVNYKVPKIITEFCNKFNQKLTTVF